MSETRIALIMGGGVSLGSFSGGALAEVVKLLKYVRRGPAKIDVVTGASAGSMTLGVVAYHLLKGSTDDEIVDALQKAWVDRISLEALCPPDLTGHAAPSIFSDRVIHEIAGEIIDVDHWTEAEPHALFAEGMRVSFALTNLNGIPVRTEGQIIRQAQSGGGTTAGRKSVFADAVQTTFHHDAMRFVIRSEARGSDGFEGDARVLGPWKTGADREAWNVFREAAIASGAFPGSFPPRRIERKSREYGKWWPEELKTDSFVFDYLDGGILRNEPLREAIHLAAEQDAGRNVERVFILIDPNVSGTNEVYPLSFNQMLLLEEAFDEGGNVASMNLSSPAYFQKLGGVLARFSSVLASQATYRDWLKAARVNSQIEWRDELIGLVDQLEPKSGSKAEEAADVLLEQIYIQRLFRSGGRDPSEQEVLRTRDRIKADLAGRAEGEEVDFSTKLKLLVDSIGNLRDKKKLNMVAITPSSTEREGDHPIAGNFMANFGGFFDRKYRDHDFKVGRHLAAKVLSEPIEGARGFLSQDVAIPPAPDPIVPDPHYRVLQPGEQRRFEDLIRGHAETAVQQINLPWYVSRFASRKATNTIVENLRKSLISAPTGTTAFFRVSLQGVKDVFLKGNRAGDARPNSQGEVDTVIAVRKKREGRVAYEMFGPHLHSHGNGSYRLELWRKGGFLRRDQKTVSIPVGGRIEDWYNMARFSSVPVVTRDVSLDGSDRPLQPSELSAAP